MRSRFDLNLMHLLVALYEDRSVTQAAKRLGISQPSVSNGLRKLRDQLGDLLFVRTGTGMEPTPRAHSIAPGWKNLIERVGQDLVVSAPFDPTSANFTATFAMSDVGEMVFLPRILAHFHRIAPRGAVRSVSLPPNLVERGLESGDIDLAVGYFPDLDKSNFLRQQLFVHHFICVLRADHPVRSKRLSLDDFLSLEHAVVRAEGRSQEIFERFLARKKISRRVVLHTPHFLSLPVILARSDLIATVPHAIGVYCESTGINVRTALPPFDIPRIPVRQHWHRRFQSDPRNRWLRSILRELFTSEADEWRGPIAGIRT
ncbi:MAG TPA: LysR family transcriptional regulator [Burkholderiaceae bacterium]|nr:LysR family transcriptional regulator [Burkholderiaceae bacterium]